MLLAGVGIWDHNQGCWLGSPLSLEFETPLLGGRYLRAAARCVG